MVTRKMMGLFCLIISGFISFGQDSIPGQKLTLQQAVEIAIKNNLEVQQSNIAMERQRVNLRQARTNMLPDLNADINHGINQGRSIDPFTNSYVDQSLTNASYNLNGGIILFNGLLIQNNIKLNNYAYEAAKLEYQQMKDNLTLDIILTYLQILNNEDQLTQAITQADVTRQQVARLEIMNEEGAIAPNLLYDLRGQLASDELTAVNTRN